MPQRSTVAEKEDKLKLLASLIKPYATLYEVGGAVRDELLGIERFDIDVCSKLRVEDVKKILLNTDFVVSDKNLRMGTVHISCGKFVCEYTTFRTDSYDTASGEHAPKDVAFTTDMSLDARRRDFKCNALYKDVETGEIVDLLGGIDDIKNKIISTADEPSVVFEADGLRVLRMVRFAAELGFEVEKNTFETARKNAWRVKDLAVERVRDEFEKILVADTKHKELGLKNAHIRGVEMLDELGIIDMLLPELTTLKDVEQPKKYHLYDAFNHSLKACEYAPPRLRFAALLHDVGKAEAIRQNGNMHDHARIGAQMADEICKRFKLPTAKRKRIVKLVALHMTDINGDTKAAKLRRFVAINYDVIFDLCDLMDADAMASSGKIDRENRIRNIAIEMQKDGSPLSVKDLKINGNDLVNIGVDEKSRAKILNALWLDTVMNPVLNDRDKALAYVEKRIKQQEKRQKNNSK